MESLQIPTSRAAAAFDALAPSYDETFTFSRIGHAQRDAVRRELKLTLLPGQHILEINCGTGVDAIDLVERGIEVLACDASAQMIEVARQRAGARGKNSPLPAGVTFRVLATEDLKALETEGWTGGFDGAFSNFAGLNCVGDLSGVARDLERLLKPGAPLILCLFGRCCLWEILWYFMRGKPRKAFRRLRSGEGQARLASGMLVNVHYPSVGKVADLFAPGFKLARWRGVGIFVPPTYGESLARRFPRLLDRCARIDRRIDSLPVMRALADHVLLTFRRRT